jgi:hypothetical protein
LSKWFATSWIIANEGSFSWVNSNVVYEIVPFFKYLRTPIIIALDNMLNPHSIRISKFKYVEVSFIRQPFFHFLKVDIIILSLNTFNFSNILRDMYLYMRSYICSHDGILLFLLLIIVLWWLLLLDRFRICILFRIRKEKTLIFIWLWAFVIIIW